ncbi:hypothetical protein GGF31_001849 [Allomyces arbusculus]|nr:hypothetical protein GGF31_001849 [Allomyces arbusculus]
MTTNNPSATPHRIVIVGAGEFGLAAALAYTRRHPSAKITVLEADARDDSARDAASCDLNKIVRFDYGGARLYERLALQAIEKWNDTTWPARGCYIESGVVFAASPGTQIADFGFAQAVLEGAKAWTWPSSGQPVAAPVAIANGLFPDGSGLGKRFPALGAAKGIEGYLNRTGGWAKASDAVTAVRAACMRAGVKFVTGTERGLAVQVIPGNQPTAVTADGVRHTADTVVVAAGAWTPSLVPAWAKYLRAQMMPVLHFHVPVSQRAAFTSDKFPVWAVALDSDTLVYGFPITGDGILKVAIDYAGYISSRQAGNDVPISLASTTTDAASTRGHAPVSGTLPATCLPLFHRAIAAIVPQLLEFPIVHARLCTYTNTPDHHFAIARQPGGIVVASGGSGHAFKFFPVLGDLIVDVATGVPNAVTDLFSLETRAVHGAMSGTSNTLAPAATNAPTLAGSAPDETHGPAPQKIEEVPLVRVVGSTLRALVARAAKI